ncbi:MAG: VWA domain-containing protein [Fimbriimonadaceae bacterium]|nr:VWA domain-containing protein [Fimbriimonadaceae bacterium]
MTRRVAVLALCVSVCLNGCGGSGHDQATPPGTPLATDLPAPAPDRGRVVFTVAWPRGTRLIPPETTRLVVAVSAPELREPVAATIDRPDLASGPVTVAMDIPAGTRRLFSAVARQVAGLDSYRVNTSPAAAELAAGTAVAAGTDPVARGIFPGQTVAADIELQAAGTPPSGATAVQVSVQQVLADSFPMVLVLQLWRDQDGNPLTNLNAANLELTENDQPAPIVDVRSVQSAETNLNCALVLDRSGSMAGSALTALRVAASDFIGRLQAGDRGAVVSFASDVTTDQPFTGDFGVLLQAVAGLTSGGSTALWDAVGRGLELVGDENGRSAVIAMTDGGENASRRYTFDALVAQATGTGVPIFTVGLPGDTFEPADLIDLAQRTGGVYHLSPTADQLTGIYQRIANQLAGQLRVSFMSPAPAPSPAPRTLRLRCHYGDLEREFVTTYVYNGPAVSHLPLDLAGSGDLGPSDPVHSGRGYYDDVRFQATLDGPLEVTMTRAGAAVADPFLLVYRDGEPTAIAADDDSGGNRDAVVRFEAAAGVRYTARFTTYRAGDTGHFVYTIRELRGRQQRALFPAATLPDGGRSRLKSP